jgi:glutamate--cysteine ligase
MLPFAFENGFGFERYVDWALDVPVYFVKRGDIYHDVAGASFRDLMAGRLRELPGERATMSDWDNHLTTLFPEVRLKRYLEMRGADGGPGRRICALPAFWVGLLYDSASLDGAWDLVRDWTASERAALRRRVPQTALATPFRNRTLSDIAREVLGLARQGLARRRYFGAEGLDEAIYLSSLDETLATGQSPAERLLAEFNGPWAGDVDRIFGEYAY